MNTMTEREVRIVRYLHANTTVSIKTLAHEFCVSTSTMSRVVSGILGGHTGQLDSEDFKTVDLFIREHIDRRPVEDRRS